MPRVTYVQAQVRREQVARLWARGRSLRGIAAELAIDFETARRDVRLVATRVAAEVDVSGELRRLLRGCREVEGAGWEAGQLGLVLASIKTQVTVLAALQGLDVLARLEAVETRLAELAAAAPPAGGFVLPNGRHTGAV